MAASSGIISIGNGLQSQVGGVSLVRNSIKKAEEITSITIPEAVIKYHKITKKDKYAVSKAIPEYYIETLSEKEQAKKQEMQQFLSRFVFVKIKEENLDVGYLKDCYMLDYIFAPVRKKGKGTNAIKNLVEKAVLDKKIDGRIIVDVKNINDDVPSVGFFYKLGFRFIDKEKNEITEAQLAKKNATLPPNLTGLMYLPKEASHKILVYKMMM